MFPEIILGPLRLDSYFVLMALALSAPILWTPSRSRAFLPGREREAYDLTLAMSLAALAGFRIFHVVFELPGYYLEHPLQIFAFWKGGFVAYGGLITPVVLAAFWMPWKKIPALPMADVLAAPVALVFGVARLACLARGCCYGAETGSAFHLVFPAGATAPPGVPLVPTQIILSASGFLCLGLILLSETRLKKHHFPGLSAAIFLLIHPTVRFVTEFWRADFRGDTLLSLSVGQWMSLALFVFGAAIFVAGRRSVRP